MKEVLKKQSDTIKGLKKDFKQLGLVNIIFTLKMLASMSTKNMDNEDVVVVDKAFLVTLIKALEDLK